MKLKAHSCLLFPLCLSLFFPMYLCLLFLQYLCSLLVTRYSAYRQVPDWVGHSRDKISKRKIRKMFLIIFFFGNVSRGYTNVSWPQICETDFLKCENCMFNILKNREYSKDWRRYTGNTDTHTIFFSSKMDMFQVQVNSYFCILSMLALNMGS